MSWRVLTAGLALAVLIGAPRAGAAGPDDLQAAFRAAFGAGSLRRVMQPQHPPGAAKGDHYRQAPVELTLKPSLLAPLGDGRYALVVSETNVLGAHMDPGAVAIAYLKPMGGRWRVENVWPEFIWTGNTGHPADAIRLLSFSKPPMVALTSQYMGQGQGSTTAWIIRLAGPGPRFLGRVPSGGGLEPDACTGCDAYDYQGAIGPPRRVRDVLSVTYVGRIERQGRWRPIRQQADFRSRGGDLVPTKPIRLPWLTATGRD